jgi:HSP20 family protein
MLTKRSPLFSNLTDLQQTINRIFEPFDEGFTKIINWAPSVDVKDEAHQYTIHADLPGVDTKNIDVRIENGVLTIKGHKESKTKEERDNYLCIERSEGTFFRSMNLPNTADATKINAKVKNGVLEIVIPKAKESTSHKINIKEE